MLNSRDTAFGLARVLADHKGEGCLVLDLGAASGWTDYFVIATATSCAHMRGLLRFVDEYVAQNGITRLNAPRVSDEEEWVLFDLGDVVVHIMTAQARAFYELEKLWFQAPATPVSAPEAAQRPQ
mgnify:CR=1 FL=1